MQSSARAALLPGALIPIAALLLLTLLIAPRFVSSGPFKYDEADYAYAARLGPWSNYVDARALSASELLSLGLGELRGEASVELSGRIRNSNDVSFYRHWHGPVYYYYLYAAGALSDWSEYGTRCATMALFLLTGIVGVWAVFRLASPGSATIASVLFAALYGPSIVNLQTAAVLAPHALFSLFSILSLTYMARYLANDVLRDWYVGLAFAGVACATLEVGLILPLTAAISCFLVRRGSPVSWPRRDALAFGGRSLLVVMLAIFVSWPAGLWKVGLLKPYGFQLFLALFRDSQWGTEISLANSWVVRLSSFPVDWLLFAAGVAIFFRNRTALRRLLPFAVFIPLMMLLLLPVATTVPRYMSPYFPVMQIFTAVAVGWALSEIKPSAARNFAVAGLCLATVAIASRHWPAMADQDTDERDWRPIELLREAKIDGDVRILAPQLLAPSLHYYFPDVSVLGYTSAAEREAVERRGQVDFVLRTEPTLELVRPGVEQR